MIDLRVAQPTLAEAVDGGGLPEMRARRRTEFNSEHTQPLSQVVIFTPCMARLRDIIHRTEVNYSEVKLYFAQD